MAQITNGITVSMIRPRGNPHHPQRRATPAVNRVTSWPPFSRLTSAYQGPPARSPSALQLQSFEQALLSVDQTDGNRNPGLIGGHPQLRQRRETLVVNRVTSAFQAPPDHQPQSVDLAPSALQLQSVVQPLLSVDQTDGNRTPEQSDGQTTRTLGSSNTDPDAPSSVTSGISPRTLFKASLGVIFAAAEALMLHHLQQQGNSAPASSKIALSIVFVTFLLAFLFIATGACMYRRFPLAAYIIGNAGFLCITLSFFAMMHVWVPQHLVGLVWTVCGILLLVFAYFFKEDLKDWRKIEADRRRRITAAHGEV